MFPYGEAEAGVSSGIDMALQLVAWELGEDRSKGVQLILEYDPPASI